MNAASVPLAYHKDIATTLGTYTFNTESMQKSAVDIFEKAVNNERRYATRAGLS